MRILVVEDEPNVVDFIEKGLKEEGYVVDVAAPTVCAIATLHNLVTYVKKISKNW